MTDKKIHQQAVKMIDNDIKIYQEAANRLFVELCTFNLCEPDPSYEVAFKKVCNIEMELAKKWDLKTYCFEKGIASLEQTRMTQRGGIVGFEHFGGYMHFLTELLKVKNGTDDD